MAEIGIVQISKINQTLKRGSENRMATTLGNKEDDETNWNPEECRKSKWIMKA